MRFVATVQIMHLILFRCARIIKQLQIRQGKEGFSAEADGHRHVRASPGFSGEMTGRSIALGRVYLKQSGIYKTARSYL